MYNSLKIIVDDKVLVCPSCNNQECKMLRTFNAISYLYYGLFVKKFKKYKCTKCGQIINPKDLSSTNIVESELPLTEEDKKLVENQKDLDKNLKYVLVGGFIILFAAVVYSLFIR